MLQIFKSQRHHQRSPGPTNRCSFGHRIIVELIRLVMAKTKDKRTMDHRNDLLVTYVWLWEPLCFFCCALFQWNRDKKMFFECRRDNKIFCRSFSFELKSMNFPTILKFPRFLLPSLLRRYYCLTRAIGIGLCQVGLADGSAANAWAVLRQ